jgi:hypothetical protein
MSCIWGAGQARHLLSPGFFKKKGKEFKSKKEENILNINITIIKIICRYSASCISP